MNRKLAIRGRMKVKGLFRLSIRFVQCTQIVLNILVTSEAAATTKTSVSSGNWNNASCWTPSGKPSAIDDVTILVNHTIILNSDEQVHNLTVAATGKFIGSTNKSLNISGDITVNGMFDMNGGNINFQNNGSAFNLGPQSTFTWSPGNNTSPGATLFTNGVENFNPTSTLIIQRWYDYSTPLGEVVSGNFGNLVINTPGGTNSIIEWNQKNKFETHLIKGTLTIDQGWITLDKTGSISSTIIGNIILTSVNSSFIAHSGTHPSSFSLTTGSITNNGGNFYGLSDGNGNINMIVTGNFNNTGNVKIINNSGISGVSNGNLVFRVDGDFNQTSGDTRIIYNVTTTNSGTFSATFKNLILSGGIFMGQSACHTGGRLNFLNITQDLTINFSKASDKFRGAGLTSIGQAINNAGLAINIGRDLIVSGITQAEFTTSASSGDELVSVHRNMTIQGCTSNFNYGTLDASHSSELFVQGNLSIQGGVCCLSKNNGTFHSVITKNLSIINGELIVKGNSGPASLIVNGAFKQTGGNFLFHSNKTLPANDIVKVQINGIFSHSGGIINFDDNVSGTEHVLSLSGDTCLLTGNGIITHAGAGSSKVCGQINFEKEGIIYYQRIGNSHLINQVIQSVNQQCELVVNNTNIKLASNSSDSIYAFKILSGGRLTLNNSTLSSNGLYTNCNVIVDSSGVISLTNEKGLYGKEGSAFNTDVNFFLHKESVVEYRGEKTQTVTGISSQPNQTEKKYGILRIIMDNIKYAAILDKNVFIRTRLELTEGNLKLNNHTLTIENGNKDAIRHVKGYIDCDLDQASSQNILCWKNMNSGIHEFPFGRSSSIYLPVVYNLLTGAGNDVNVSTSRTDKNNVPYPSGTGMLPTDMSFADSKAVDRWWSISAPGIKADITFTYYFDENIISSQLTKSSLSVMAWTGSSWTRLMPSGSISYKYKSSISLHNVNNGKQFVIVSNDNIQQFELKLFEATRNENEVLLNWETVNEMTSTTYKVEKSTDGINFYEIGTLENSFNTNNLSNYNFSDKQLPGGILYYRLKYINNNKILYSEVKMVTSKDDFRVGQVKINSVSPNPFISSIKIQYQAIDKSAMLELIDAEGRRVLNMPVESIGAEQGYAILNLEYLKKGIYFLSITNNGKKETVKIIKNE